MEKHFVGSGKNKNGVVEIRLNIDELIPLIKQTKEAGYRDLILWVGKRRTVGKYGETHYVYKLITDGNYKPKKKATSKPQEPKTYFSFEEGEVINGEPITEDDIDF